MWRLWLVVVIGGLILPLWAVPVAAHGNGLAVDSQVSPDGTIRMEFVASVSETIVVLHRTNDGNLGGSVGSTAVDPGVYTNLTVEIDEDVWANVSDALELRVVLHYDQDGDDTYDPGGDPALTYPVSGEAIADTIAVGSGDGRALVVAEGEHPQRTGQPAVSIRHVRLDRTGFLVLKIYGSDGPGAVIGHRSLAPGRHDNVTVSIDEGAYLEQPERFDLRAILHGSDGADGFQSGSDRPIRVAGRPVATTFAVERTDDRTRTPHEHTASEAHHEGDGTATATPEGDPHEGDDRTETATAEDEHDDQHHESTHTTGDEATPSTPTSNARTAADPTGSERVPTTAPGDEPTRQAPDGSPTSTPGQAGFVPWITALVLLGGWRLVLAVDSRRR